MPYDNCNIKRKVAKADDGREFVFQCIEFLDKTIFQIYAEGEIDSTIDIQLPSIVNDTSMEGREEEEEIESKIKASYIVGDTSNLKTLILSTQLGKLLVKLNKNEKSVILNTSSKIFSKGDETSDEDFTILMFVLQSIKSLL